MICKQNKKLTPKQEKFTLKYFECGNASEAYRYAYSVRSKSDDTVYVASSNLLNEKKNPKITLRLKELQDKAEAESKWNVQKLIKAHTQLFEISIGDVASSHIVTESEGNGITKTKEVKMRDTNLSSAIKSLIEIGKLLGYYSNKVEQENELSIKDFAKEFYEEKKI